MNMHTNVTPNARLVAFGQNQPRKLCHCKADMLIKGQEVNNIESVTRCLQRTSSLTNSLIICFPIHLWVDWKRSNKTSKMNTA